MTSPIQHANETSSNAIRATLAQVEPRSLRTYTPSQAVLAKSAGVYHWTPEGRRLYDFTSGVLVSNLGHNPRAWMERFQRHMGWSDCGLRIADCGLQDGSSNPQSAIRNPQFCAALPMTAYNAVTPLEIEATKRLLAVL